MNVLWPAKLVNSIYTNRRNNQIGKNRCRFQQGYSENFDERKFSAVFRIYCTIFHFSEATQHKKFVISITKILLLRYTQS